MFGPSASWCQLIADFARNGLIFAIKRVKKRMSLGLQFSLKHDASFVQIRSNCGGYLRRFRGILWVEGEDSTHEAFVGFIWSHCGAFMKKCQDVWWESAGGGISSVILWDLTLRLLREQHTTAGKTCTCVYWNRYVCKCGHSSSNRVPSTSNNSSEKQLWRAQTVGLHRPWWSQTITTDPYGWPASGITNSALIWC